MPLALARHDHDGTWGDFSRFHRVQHPSRSALAKHSQVHVLRPQDAWSKRTRYSAMSLLSSHYSEADSRPALTRESTAYGTESTLPTPLDEPSLGPRLKPRGPNLTGNAGSRCLHIDTARVHTPSQDDDGYSSNAAPQDVTDSYFALTTRPPPSPIRRNTAKDLINQFENISSRPQAKVRQTVAPSAGSVVRRESPLPDIPPPLSELRSKSKNTLRASFRSIISIFGKRGKGKQTDELLLGTRYEEASQGHPSPVVISTPRLQPSPPPVSIKSTVVRSGPLLYLSRPISGGALPVWTNCSASLSSAQILLEWNTTYGNPCSRIIMLKGSNNVRSLSKPEVDPTEKSLLPDTSRDAYVFEVTYDCSESERFAMNSVAERSAWVSAIWDALLQLGSQCEDQVRPSEEIREQFDESKNETPLHLDDETESGTYLKPPFVTSTSYLQESLSSLPDEVDEVVLLPLSQRSSVLQQNSELMRSISNSTTTPPNTNLGVQLYKSKTSSPSVQNLDNLSVVPRRLSQLSDDKEINVDLSHKPTQISIGRQGSVASKYSVLSEEQCGRPFILEASHLNALNDMAARRNIDQQREQASGHGDDQSIFDLYTDKMTTNKPLSPILDESEVRTTESPLSISELHELEENTKASYDLGYSAARTDSTSNDGQVVNSPSLVALIQDHAVQQFSQTSDLTHHVITLKNDITTMSKDLRGVLSEQVPGSEVRRVLEDLCIKIDAIGGQVQLLKESDMNKQQIDENGDDTLPTIRTRMAGAHEDDTSKLSGFSETLDRVEERLGRDLPGILDLLGSLQKSGTEEVMQNIQAKIEELLQLAKVEKSAETLSSSTSNLNPVLLSDIPKPPETPVSATISDRNSAAYLLIDILLKSTTEKHPEYEVDPCKEDIGKKVTIYSLTILDVLKRVLARGSTVASSERYRAEEDPVRTAK